MRKLRNSEFEGLSPKAALALYDNLEETDPLRARLYTWIRRKKIKQRQSLSLKQWCQAIRVKKQEAS